MELPVMESLKVQYKYDKGREETKHLKMNKEFPD